jgi:hypothetical protein
LNRDCPRDWLCNVLKDVPFQSAKVECVLKELRSTGCAAHFESGRKSNIER